MRGGDPLEPPGANPQLEDGFTRIANEIMEALPRLHLSGNQGRILWVVLRKTYGWSKKVDPISLGQFESMTGIKRRHVCRELKGLVERNILRKTEGKGVPGIGNSFVTSYGLQKDFTKWKVFPKSGTVPKTGNRSVPKIGNHKIKERKKKYVLHHGTEKIPLQDGIQEVLEVLNVERSRILGADGIKPITASGEIQARLKEGRTVSELCRVVLTKAEDPWFKENLKYFHPRTLFRKSNFEKYADEAELLKVRRARGQE